MNAASSSPLRPPRGDPIVSSDFSALASHMQECERSRGPFFGLKARLEAAHALVSPRIVTAAALVLVCTLSLLAVA